MEQKRDRLYPSAPSENFDLGQRLEKKTNDVNNFNNPLNSLKEMITYFKYKNNNPQETHEKYETITTIIKSFDTFVTIATTSSSLALSPTGIGLIAIPISTATASRLSIGNKVIYEININKNNKDKKQYEKDQQTSESLDKLYKKFLQDNVIDKNEYDSLCNIFTKHIGETKNEFFCKNEHKNEIKLF